VKGRDEVIELVLIALLGDGHVLLEDYPGSGKTTLAKALGDSIADDHEPDDDIPPSGACSSRPTCCRATSPGT
jgi:MoxR-like ATPase